MQLIEEIGKAATDEEALRLCQMWADGKNTDNFWRETLAAKAVVKSIVFTPDERIREFKKLYQTRSVTDFPDEEFYKCLVPEGRK